MAASCSGQPTRHCSIRVCGPTALRADSKNARFGDSFITQSTSLSQSAPSTVGAERLLHDNQMMQSRRTSLAALCTARQQRSIALRSYSSTSAAGGPPAGKACRSIGCKASAPPQSNPVCAGRDLGFQIQSIMNPSIPVRRTASAMERDR